MNASAADYTNWAFALPCNVPNALTALALGQAPMTRHYGPLRHMSYARMSQLLTAPTRALNRLSVSGALHSVTMRIGACYPIRPSHNHSPPIHTPIHAHSHPFRDAVGHLRPETADAGVRDDAVPGERGRTGGGVVPARHLVVSDRKGAALA